MTTVANAPGEMRKRLSVLDKNGARADMQKSRTTSTESAVIEIRDVAKHYGKFVALERLSLSIMDNEFFTLLGPSGCGKTTLLRLIAGFDQTSSGTINLFGKDIAKLPPNLRPVNTVFQNYALFPHLTVLQNVMFGLEMRGKPRDAAIRRAGEMLDLVQLSSFQRRKPAELSGGQQQRVALARALAPEPKLLLLDEPLSALDLKLRQAMRFELKAIQRETGITFIFVTHDQEEALTMSDRIAVMSAGRLQQLGLPKEIYERPSNRFVADFIGETNLLEVTFEEVGPEGVLCRLRGGHKLHCATIPGVTAGANAHISVRPERLFLSDARIANESLAGIVEQNVYIGSDVQTLVKLDDGLKMTARAQNSHKGAKAIFEPGTQVFVNIEAGAARLLVS